VRKDLSADYADSQISKKSLGSNLRGVADLSMKAVKSNANFLTVFLSLRNLRILSSPAFGALFGGGGERSQALHFLFESFSGHWTSIRHITISRSKHKTAIGLARRFVRCGC
jgi:hypothetical protein